jgi:uncharacterized membrane protein
MANRLIVAVFDSLDTAEKACRDFRAYAEKGQGLTIHSGVVVEKDASGKLTFLDRQTRSFWGTTIGALTGALIGMLGGPAGAILGFTAGASAGLNGHALRDLLDSELVKSISAKLTATTAAGDSLAISSLLTLRLAMPPRAWETQSVESEELSVQNSTAAILKPK